MKRVSLLLLPALLLTALAPFAPFTTPAQAVSGAGFTTVNVAIDGPGHCANGNPLVNCNIYNGKPYVWLNGGPAANKLGPSGKYFFAVLSPGGQLNPNDGSPKNLSDNFDAYSNRTFTVANGKVSAYSGTHPFSRNLIRVFPYANTSNPGGVYILAICSLARGYPVKAGVCKYDQFKVIGVACTPKTEHANFARVPVGSSVEGLGTVAPDLDIRDQVYTGPVKNLAVRIAEGVDPLAYLAFGPAGLNTVTNGGLHGASAFADPLLGSVGHPDTNDADPAHFRFTFAPNVTITDFQLHMYDYGDWNPKLAIDHLVTLTAYDADNVPVGNPKTLAYRTVPPVNGPTRSNLYGDLMVNGDAARAPDDMPGNWNWHITGTGIARVDLEVGVGPDGNFALGKLSFTTECP